MDIYRAVRVSDSLLDFITGINSSDSKNMYTPTLKKLKHIGDICKSVSEQTDSILNESEVEVSTTVTDISECIGAAYEIQSCMIQYAQGVDDLLSSTIERLTMLYNICGQIQTTIRQIVPSSAISPSFNTATDLDQLFAQFKQSILQTMDVNHVVVTSPQVVQNPDSSSIEPEFDASTLSLDTEIDEEIAPSFEDQSFVDTVDTEPVYDKGGILRQYESAFKLLATKESNYENIHTCSQLLYEWLTARFFGKDPKFRYNMKQLPEWVMLIVASYGKSLEKGEEIQFTRRFRGWLENLGIAHNPYAVPKEVHQLTKRKVSGATLTGLVMWDILWDDGLFKVGNSLSVQPPNPYLLHRSLMSDMAKETNFKDMDRYSYYRMEPEVLSHTPLAEEGNPF